MSNSPEVGTPGPLLPRFLSDSTSDFLSATPRSDGGPLPDPSDVMRPVVAFALSPARRIARVTSCGAATRLGVGIGEGVSQDTATHEEFVARQVQGNVRVGTDSLTSNNTEREADRLLHGSRLLSAGLRQATMGLIDLPSCVPTAMR